MANGIGRVFAKKLHAAFDRTAGADNVNKALKVLRSDTGPHFRKLEVCDKLLGTHGVEALGAVDAYKGPPFEYLNTGDSYAATLVWSREAKPEWRVTSWGDLVETGSKVKP